MATAKGFSDIFEQLEHEHDEVQKLFDKAEHSPASERKALLEQIEHELVPHSRAEEKTLYANLLPKAHDLTNDSYEEHLAVDHLMAELKQIEVTSDVWLAKLVNIRGSLDHHIAQEEGPMFTKAKDSLSDDDLEMIHENYKIAKERYMDTLPTQEETDARVAFAPNY